MHKTLINLILISLTEVIQGRVYQALLVVAFLAPLFGYLLSSLFLVDIGKVYMDAILAVTHFLSIVFTLFIVGSLLARDIEQKVCYLFVVEPSSREHYLFGRFLSFLAAFGILLLTIDLISIFAGYFIFTQETQPYWSGYTWKNMSLLLFLHGLQYVSLLAFVFFIASWATGLAEILFFSMMGLLVSWVLPPILTLVNPSVGGEQSSELLFEVLRGVYQFLPHLNGANIALALTHGEGLPVKSIMFYVAEHLGYVGVFISLAVWFFQRRDL